MRRLKDFAAYTSSVKESHAPISEKFKVDIMN